MRLTRIAATFAALTALVAGPLPGAGGATPDGRGPHHDDDPVVRTLTTFAAAGCTSGCGSGSTIGPDGALYVTDGPGGRVLRIDPDTGATTTFANGLPPALPQVGIGGAVDVIFVGSTAYVAVTLVGPDFGQTDVVSGLYRIDDGVPTPVADIGAWSAANPPDTDFFVPSGVAYALERYRGRLLVTDGHLNRVLSVSREGDISELQTFGNTVPTGLEVDRGEVYMAEAGPVPHHPEDGRVVRFRADGPTSVVASGGPLLVDVEAGHQHRMYALSQGIWDLPDLPENAGAPASPDTGALMLATEAGDLVPLVEGLDRPTSMEIRGGTAWVVTLTGTVLRIDGI